MDDQANLGTPVEIEEVRSRPARIILSDGAVLDLSTSVAAVYRRSDGNYHVRSQNNLHIAKPARRTLKIVKGGAVEEET